MILEAMTLEAMTSEVEMIGEVEKVAQTMVWLKGKAQVAQTQTHNPNPNPNRVVMMVALISPLPSLPPVRLKQR
jgi:hypothetical protein